MEDNTIEFFEFTEEMKQKANEIVCTDASTLSPFVYTKFEQKANKMWNDFYRHNTTNFYKDRHYIVKEFPELKSLDTLLEVGCGVGNAIYPIIQEVPTLKVQACDFSSQGIKLLKEHEHYDESKINACVCDITIQAPPFQESCDGILMLFVLSAISPEFHIQSIMNATSTLRPGGMIFFRDYARYDLAQLRLAKKGKKKLKDNFYLKQDGTRVYYFTLEDIENIFSGFRIAQNEYHYRLIKNRKDQKDMHRVWIQAKFIKC
jgi:methyltransferase-like protein 6